VTARLTAAALLTCLAGAGLAQDHEHVASPSAPEHLGSVHFATSCRADVGPTFDRAVALLHSFEFAPAIEAFEGVGRADPSCGIAYWGVALAAWGNPFAASRKTPGQIERARAALDHAARVAKTTARERAYVDAVAELYRDAEHRDQSARVLSYRDAMAALSSAHPEDMEARIFYALALAQAVPATDKTYGDLLKAGEILEGLFPEHPDHPGLAHYIIHAYDVPALAPRALAAARRYATIAPSAPHALHMPSHTFTRLGYWQESIDTNIASAAAAKRDGAVAEELHATDYLTYAYLQTGQDEAAKSLVDALPEITARFDPDAVGSAAPGVAGVFALAAIPARWALERGDWAAAAKLAVHTSRFAQTEAMTYFGRAIGAARSGDAAAARSAVGALREIQGRLEGAGEAYWAGQVEIEARAATAWLALAEGRRAEALAAMREAVELEDSTEKNAITPGPLAPSRELLGEMLLEAHEPAQALKEFEAVLTREPGRFRAVAGAARAAAGAGDLSAAARYRAQLLESCVRGDRPGRLELADARRLGS
jgi:hypothetical protein